MNRIPGANGDGAKHDDLSPELRETLLEATSRAGLSEDDPIYALLLAQADLLDKGFESQTRFLNSTLDAFLSARQADNKQLAALVADSNASITEATCVIVDQANVAAAQLQALKDLLHKEFRDHRAAFEKEIHELRARMGDVQTAAHKVRSAAEQLLSFRQHLILWSHLITFTGGALGTLLLLLAFKK